MSKTSFTPLPLCKPLAFIMMRVKLHFHFGFTHNHAMFPLFSRGWVGQEMGFSGVIRT